MSLVVGVAVVYALPSLTLFGEPISAPVAVAYATAVGVLIDLDHFLLARLRTGHWEAVRFCLANPRAAIVDQARIFDRGDVGVLHRLLSHLLLSGLLVGLLALVSVSLAVLTAVVLYAHLFSDVAWDVHQLENRQELQPVDRAIAD